MRASEVGTDLKTTVEVEVKMKWEHISGGVGDHQRFGPSRGEIGRKIGADEDLCPGLLPAPQATKEDCAVPEGRG